MTDRAPERHGTSIRRKLILLLALAILPIGLVGLVVAVYSYNRERQNFLKDVYLMADFVANERDRQLTEVHNVLVAVASTFNIARANEPECSEGLRRTLATFPTYANIGYLDRKGDLICSAVTPAAPVNAAKASWFKSAIEGQKIAVSRALISRVSKGQIIFVAVPVREKSEIDGVLGASILVWKLSKRPAALRYAEDSHSAMLDNAGGLIISTGRGDDDEDAWLPPAGTVRERLEKNELVFTRVTEAGAEYMYVMHPIALNRAVSLLAVRMDDKIRSIWLNFAWVAALPVLMWVTAVAAAWFGVDRLIVRPILKLRRVTQAYASGDLTYRQPDLKKAPKELLELSRSLSDMASAIERRNSALKSSLERNRSLVREIHHRVKNNLQLIASIISTRARATNREDEQELLAEIANRVRALAIVHAEFRGPDQAMAIDLRDVVRNIVAQHQATGEDEEQNVKLTFAETCRVDIDDAVPTALLISEILSDLRQLSDDEDRDEIGIALTDAPNEMLDLTIDIEMPYARRLADPEGPVSGRLISALAQQLKARVEIRDDDNVRIVARMACVEPTAAVD